MFKLSPLGYNNQEVIFMSKRKRKTVNSDLVEQGTGENYVPAITIQDFPSKGRVSRIKGITTNRQHELFSDLERNYFYYLDYAKDVVDIREQYALLPIEETLLIANELGIEHPYDYINGKSIPMTTDFLIDFIDNDGNIIRKVRTLKYKEELLNKRIIEKFEIERLYFERQGIDWGIVTECEIDKNVANIISDLYTYLIITEVEGFIELDDEIIEDLKLYFLSLSVDYEGTLRQLCQCFEKSTNLHLGCGIAMFKHLLITKKIYIDIYDNFNFNRHIDISIIEDESKIKSVI